jgi:hypothetical protein
MRPNFAVTSRIGYVSIHRFATTQGLGNELKHQGCYLSAHNMEMVRISFGHQDKPSKSH